jgi:FkbM family methyltransferase
MTLDEMRADVRAREVVTLDVDGIRTSFFDQRGALAACHRKGWCYEPAMLARIAGLGRPGAYLDVGANLGNHTVFFAQHCPATTVHAFEPVDVALAMLVENVALNGLTNVSVHPFGLSAQEGQFETQVGNRRFAISCRRLDDLHLDGPLAVVVKVDVEGMELDVVRGAERTLRRDLPLMYVEAHSTERLAELEATLGGIGLQRTGRVFKRLADIRVRALRGPAPRLSVASPEPATRATPARHRGDRR